MRRLALISIFAVSTRARAQPAAEGLPAPEPAPRWIGLHPLRPPARGRSPANDAPAKAAPPAKKEAPAASRRPPEGSTTAASWTKWTIITVPAPRAEEAAAAEAEQRQPTPPYLPDFPDELEGAPVLPARSPGRAEDRATLPLSRATTLPLAAQAALSPMFPPLITGAQIDEIMFDDVPAPRGGVLVRASAGPSLGRIGVTSADQAAAKRSELGVGFDLLAGIWISRDVVVAAQAALTTAVIPMSLILTGPSGEAISTEEQSLGVTTLSGGANVSLALADRTTHLSAGLLLTKLRLVDRATSYLVSGTGFSPGLEVGVTHEWPLTDKWDLGFGLRVSGCLPSDDAHGLAYSIIETSLGLSITYD